MGTAGKGNEMKKIEDVIDEAVRGAREAGRRQQAERAAVKTAAEIAGEISADELERAEKELDKMTQEHVEQVDKAFTRKEQELLEV